MDGSIDDLSPTLNSNCNPSPISNTNSDQIPIPNSVDGELELDGNGSPIPNEDEIGEGVEGEIQVPTIGMTFRSWEEVETMYKAYGKAQGFGIARTQAARNVKHERRAMTWKCECWGEPNMRQMRERRRMEQEMEIGGTTVFERPKGRNRKSKKCDCGAMLYASVNKDEWWEVKQVVLDHTGHNPLPSDSRLVKEYRMQSFTSNLKKRLLNDAEVGVPIDQIHGSIARERDGLANMPITPKDMRHVVDEARKLKLEGGDSEALMGYLDRMRRDNNEFYYSIRVDVTGGLQDVFWVDARSKAAYEEFGDVVCFDTTYMTNDYELPFANFVGVNHHGQTTLFGCALMSHEDVESFTWVFQKWLLCMDCKAPAAILTDQAPAMRRPIAEVFPDTTTHRWCLWHIMQKVPYKLGGLSKYKKIKRDLKDVIYNSYTEEEFEERWSVVIAKYKLKRNKWLTELFAERSMWVPAFMRDRFWAGMRTTQRVESIHSFFDKFVKSHRKLIEFGEKYIAAVEKRMCQERDADDRDRKWHREPATKFALERYFADIYTDEKFLAFSKQCERVTYGWVYKESDLDEYHKEYIINDSVWLFKEGCRIDFLSKQRRLYHLVFNVVTLEAICECRMFETHGIMCRHIVRVLFQNGITVPPEMYVLHRWKKNVDRKHTRIKVAYHDPRRTEEVKRLDKMQVLFDTLADKACWHEARTNLVIDTLTKLLEEVQLVTDDGVNSQQFQGVNGHVSKSPCTEYNSNNIHQVPNTSTPKSWHDNLNVSQTLRDPARRQKRGRPKGSRVKSLAEMATTKNSKSKKCRKNDETSSTDSEECEEVEGGSPSPPSLPQTRSKSGVARKKARKRLKDEFDSSSDEQSVSF